MNEFNLEVDDTKSTDDCTRKEFRAFVNKRRLIILILIAVHVNATLFPVLAYSQSLDDAVNSQLEVFQNQTCGRLLSAGGVPAAGSGLDDICNRFVPGQPADPTVSGGGAATSTALPNIVQERMDEKRDEEETKADSAISEGRKQLEIFVSVEEGTLDREVTTFEDGYDSDIQRFTIGTDFQITESWLTGLAFDTARQDGNFEGNRGDFEVESYGIVGFGSVIPTANSFVQFYAKYSRNSYDRSRIATFTDENGFVTPGNPDADYDASQYSAGILAGYDFPKGGFTITLSAGVDWSQTEYDTYSEEDVSGLALTFHDDEETSLLSTVGISSSITGSSDFGVVVAHQSIHWKHQHDKDQRRVEVSFVDDTQATRFTYKTESPDRDFFELNTGISIVFPKGVQMFLNYRTLLGHKLVNNDVISIGARIEL